MTLTNSLRILAGLVLSALALQGVPAAAARGSCLLVGDSTMVGTAAALRTTLGVECDVQARERVATSAILQWKAATGRYRVAVIGSGSNDADSPVLRRNLTTIRDAIHADRVIWLKPYHRGASAVVDVIAAAKGDATVDLAGFPSRDRVHPANYAAVARAIASLPATPARYAAATTPRPGTTGRVATAAPATAAAAAGRRADIITAY